VLALIIILLRGLLLALSLARRDIIVYARFCL
jgi:hypothetical protein